MNRVNIANIIRSKIGSGRSATVKINAFGSILIKGWSILISLILVPMTIGYLSSELYGIWLTLSSVIMWLNFFDVGFTLGLKNKLAEALANNDVQRGKVLVSTTYGMMLAIFIPLGMVMEIGIPYINWSAILNVSQELNPQLIGVMRILTFCFSLQMILNTITAVLTAYQKTAFSNIFPVIGNSIAVVVIYLLTKFVPPSLITLSQAISYLPVIVLFISSIILYKTILKDVAPEIILFDRNATKDLFTLGAKFFLLQIQVVVFYQTTNVLISHVSSPEQVTTFNIAFKYLSIATMLYNILLGPLWPAFTDAYTKRDYNWMQKAYKKMKVVYFIVCIAMVIMMSLSSFMYRIWLNQIVTIPWIMTISTGIYLLINGWNNLQMLLINGIGALKIQTYVVLLGMFAHIPLSLFLGRYIGGVGVIWSMITISLIYAPIFTIQLRKILSGVQNTIWNK